METRKLWASLIMTAFTLIVLCAVLTVSTYAWFTFDPYTNVTPMEGKISDGDTNLLISENKNGPFDKKCGLNPEHKADALYPVSTLELDKIFASKAQKEGISTHFTDVTQEPEKWLIHGRVYLTSLGTACKVYFDRETLDLGDDIQILAAARLGLKITGEDGQTATLIFRLDDLGDTTKAESQQTVEPEEDVVVASVDEGYVPTFKEDPSVNMGTYMITADQPKELCTVGLEEVVEVEYWLYLEGCDDQCCNLVQTESDGHTSREIVLKLGFAGEKVEAET